MLEQIKGYLLEEQFYILISIEYVLEELYEYRVHHIELALLVAKLQDDSDYNSFYTEIIEMYKGHVNRVFGILGLSVNNDMLLQDKTLLLKALADINDKAIGLKQEAYQKMEAYETNEEKLTFTLAALCTLEDPLLINDIFKVSDAMIEDLEDMLNGNEDDLKEVVYVSLLKKLGTDLLGNTKGIVETMDVFTPYIERNVQDILREQKGLFVTEDNELLNTIVLALLFSKNGREDSSTSYLTIKEYVLDEDKEGLNTFIYSIIDKMHSGLKDKGL